MTEHSPRDTPRSDITTPIDEPDAPDDALQEPDAPDDALQDDSPDLTGTDRERLDAANEEAATERQSFGQITDHVQPDDGFGRSV